MTKIGHMIIQVLCSHVLRLKFLWNSLNLAPGDPSGSGTSSWWMSWLWWFHRSSNRSARSSRPSGMLYLFLRLQVPQMARIPPLQVGPFGYDECDGDDDDDEHLKHSSSTLPFLWKLAKSQHCPKESSPSP